MVAGCPSFDVVQAESDTRAAAAKQAIMKYFIIEIRPFVGHTLWGVTVPCFPLSETTHALQSGKGVPERIGRID